MFSHNLHKSLGGATVALAAVSTALLGAAPADVDAGVQGHRDAPGVEPDVVCLQQERRGDSLDSANRNCSPERRFQEVSGATR